MGLFNPFVPWQLLEERHFEIKLMNDSAAKTSLVYGFLQQGKQHKPVFMKSKKSLQFYLMMVSNVNLMNDCQN